MTRTLSGADRQVRDSALLSLMQWLSPAFPVGSFAYSQGLEWLICAGEIASARDLQNWLVQMLLRGTGRTDAILLALALQEGADLGRLSSMAQALCPGPERLAETLAQGAAFVAATNALTGASRAPMPYPVAVGAVAQGCGLPAEQVIALWLQAWAQGLMQAAVRFVPLGATEGQQVLAALQPGILALSAEVASDAALGRAEPGSATLRADLATMQHEFLETRIFRT